MKILLTGHKGFIGSHMLTALENAGHFVDTYEWGDNQLPSVMEQDWVIHIGAISATTEKDIEKVLTQNLDFSIQLYNACRFYEVNFQYASSASVYGLNQEFTEESPVDPRTPYAWSKYLFERYVKRHSAHYSIAQGFRYFNVYGNGEEDKGDQSSPVSKFIKQIKETGKLNLFEGSDKFFRDFICVDDIVNIVLNNDKPSGIYDLGTSNPISFQKVADFASKKYNGKIEYIPFPDHLKGKYQDYTCSKKEWGDHKFITVEEYLQ